MNLILSTVQIITIVLILEPLITQTITISSRKTSTTPIIKKTTTKILHNISSHRTTNRSHSTVLHTIKKSTVSTRKVTTTPKPVKTTHSTRLTAISTKIPQLKDKSYSSLIIVGSISAVIVISVTLYVLYIQCKEGNGLLRENGLQLNSITNNNLDIQSSSLYLNRGIIAFHEVSNEIIENRKT